MDKGNSEVIDTSLMDSDENQEKIEVKFVTQQDEFRVTDKPFQVPIEVGRRDLSSVINHLLGKSRVYPPFES